MKALVKREARVGLWLEDIPEPTIGINDVLIRIKKTGICGTDVHIYKWDAWAQKTIPVPMAVGHEFVGEVVEVGSNVTDFHPGDRVSSPWLAVSSCSILPRPDSNRSREKFRTAHVHARLSPHIVRVQRLIYRQKRRREKRRPLRYQRGVRHRGVQPSRQDG